MRTRARRTSENPLHAKFAGPHKPEVRQDGQRTVTESVHERHRPLTSSSDIAHKLPGEAESPSACTTRRGLPFLAALEIRSCEKSLKTNFREPDKAEVRGILYKRSPRYALLPG